MYPALAVLNALKVEPGNRAADGVHPGTGEMQVLWLGGAGGMEAELVGRIGIPFDAIPAAGVHGVGWRALPGNILQLGRGLLAARGILNRFQPDVMLFTGGFVAVPVAIASLISRSRQARPRSLVYVPDIEPALALKVVSRLADRIAVTVEATRTYFKNRTGVVVTGYPVRADLQKWDRQQAFEALELSPELPTIFIFGGSKGSRSINQALRLVLPELLPDMQVIHVSGNLDWPAVQASRDDLARVVGENMLARYKSFPYLHAEMGAAYTVADLVICRAGASTLGELPLFGVPAILVPYPYAWRYQQINAEYLAERGAAQILQDGELNTKLLLVVKNLIQNQAKLASMRAAMIQLDRPDAASQIAAEVWSLGATIGGSL